MHLPDRIFVRKYVFNQSNARPVPQKPCPRKPIRAKRCEDAPLTPQQAKAVTFIKERLGEGKPFPSQKEMAWHLGHVYPSYASFVFQRLAARGILKRLHPRGWRLVSESDNEGFTDQSAFVGQHARTSNP